MSSQLKSQSDKTIAEHDAHASEKAASAPTQPVIEYPTMKRMFTIMLALFCSIFLVSLASSFYRLMLNLFVGPYDSEHRNSYNHRSVSLPRRRRLVW